MLSQLWIRIKPLEHQVPAYQECTQTARRKEDQTSRALPLRSPLQLLVPSSEILIRQLRVGHELADVRGLDIEILRQRRVELSDFVDGAFGGAASNNELVFFVGKSMGVQLQEIWES